MNTDKIPSEGEPRKLTIKRIYHLLGPVVLLAVRGEGKNGKAPIDKGWKIIPFRETQDPDYQAKLLHAKAVGVRLGSESNNICTIDIDQDEWVEPFLKLNPLLAGVLRTRGARGAQIWLKMKGDYPHKKIIFRTQEQIDAIARGEKAEHVAEFRTDGGQSVIRGFHHKIKKFYQLLVDDRPGEPTYEELNYPPEWIAVGEQAEKEKPPPAHEQGDSLRTRIRRHIHELCQHYYPDGNDEGNEYRLGSAKAEAGTSFCICLEGENAGSCYEHNGNQGGFFTDALALKLGVSVTEAETMLKRFFARSSLGQVPILDEQALYGVAGRIARRAAEISEADAVGVLVQILVGFGNMVGRGPFFHLSCDFHRCNLNALIVGQTSRDRKGMALNIARSFLSWVDDDYIKNNVRSGLSSGEGLIAQVQDEIKDFRRPTAAERKAGQHEPVEYIRIPGVADKRLWVAETEFGGVIVVMGREGNILSKVIRQFWDGDNYVKTMVKNSPVSASFAHLSICGHITHAELTARLPEVENYNGFANRFFWVLVRRERYIAVPQGIGPSDFKEELEHFLQKDAEGQTLLERARKVNHMQWSPAAEAFYKQIYRSLEEPSEATPVLDAILGRGSGTTIRLSMIYALLDRSNVIDLAHVKAGYALWLYGRNTVRYLFSEKLSNVYAERLLAEFKKRSPAGMTRREINDFFGGNLRTEVIEAVIRELTDMALVRYQSEQKAKAGPKTTTYFYDPN